MIMRQSTALPFVTVPRISNTKLLGQRKSSAVTVAPREAFDNSTDQRFR